ncbi:MAG: L-serine ammonia-lyase, iron-sulfur-dependent, subunit alpha [Holophaga sp.]|nr:L-serine ammonia-lyase, iron-sulfur-dependent, subunit alpha [Holophaga sp.]
MIPLYPEFFNDVFGPVMQPGSSSHQAGPCRLGLLAASLLGEPPLRAEFHLDPAGSFAGTFGLMNEDLGLAAGVLGLGPDDPRLFDARNEARRRGVELAFTLAPVPESAHPNAVKIRLGGAARTVTLVGNSVGGGMVEVVSLEGFPVSFQGDAPVVLVFGETGFRPPELLASGRSEHQGRVLCWFKTAAAPARLPAGALLLAPVLPVSTLPGRQPQLFDTMAGWRALAAEAGTGLAEIALRYEERASAWPRPRIIKAMERIRALLHAQVHAAFGPGGAGPAEPFGRRDDRLWAPHLAAGRSFLGPATGLALKLALGVNAKTRGVPIVPGPMGTGGGYLYSALYAVQQDRGCTDEALLRGLFVAAGVGAIAYTRTEPTGEVIGCAGETGVCSAMAAAALVEMAGGTPLQAEHAASFAIQAATGMPCDPIPGGFEQPCLSRIVAAVSNALAFADLALAGSDAILPFHEALDVADRVGRALAPELKCTARGGCCATPTGRLLAERFHRAGTGRLG